MALARINEKMFVVIDTPGIVLTDKINQEISKEIEQAILQCAYGIQAIVT
jgi:hypothetical protein